MKQYAVREKYKKHWMMGGIPMVAVLDTVYKFCTSEREENETFVIFTTPSGFMWTMEVVKYSKYFEGWFSHAY